MDTNELDDDEVLTYNFRELMDLLNEHKDVTITIPSEQFEELRAGLQVRKSRDNYAMRKKHIEPPAEILDFTTTTPKDSKDKDIEGQLSVRIKLKPRKGIDILKIELPDPEI